MVKLSQKGKIQPRGWMKEREGREDGNVEGGRIKKEKEGDVDGRI